MAQNVTLYNLLISCPGDIKEEVTLIEAAVDEFNELAQSAISELTNMLTANVATNFSQDNILYHSDLLLSRIFAYHDHQ